MRNPCPRLLRVHGYLLASIGCGIGLIIVSLLDADNLAAAAGLTITGVAMISLSGLRRAADEQFGLGYEAGRAAGYAEGYVAGLSRPLLR